MSNNSSIADVNNGLDYILLFRLIVWGYVGMVLSLFGIVGNLITILVLISPSMRTTSTNIYLTALSCSNILFLLIFIPSYSMRYLLGYRLYMADKPFAFEILLIRLPTTPIYNTILLSIIYLTIAVSMDRLVLVKFPLKAKQILTPRTTLIAILLIYIFCIVYCIPYWLEQHYDPKEERCILTEIGRKIHKYIRIYIYIPVVYLIPFITLTCINITIIQYLIAKKRRKKSLGAKTKNKKKQADYYITLMLVTVIIVFVLSQIPLLVLNAWHAIDTKGSTRSLLFHSLNTIGILLIVLNTSTNFLLYCFFGQKFRQTLIEFIFHILPNHKQSDLQTRISKLAEKNTQFTRLSERQIHDNLLLPSSSSQPIQRISSGNSSTTTTNDVKRSVELNQNLEDSSPLITNSTQISIVKENLPFKPDHKLNLYTCTNGKRILVLKI